MFYNIHIDKIETVQKKFIKALDIRTGHDYIAYIHSTARHKEEMLKSHRDYIDTIRL